MAYIYKRASVCIHHTSCSIALRLLTVTEGVRDTVRPLGHVQTGVVVHHHRAVLDIQPVARPAYTHVHTWEHIYMCYSYSDVFLVYIHKVY